jgi:hypothetical protein
MLSIATLFVTPAFAGQRGGHGGGHVASASRGAAMQSQSRGNFASASRAAAPSFRGAGPVVGQAAPRGTYGARYAPSYGGRYYGPSYSRGYGYGYGSGYYRPGLYVRPFGFRPHFALGFGIYAGYPVPWAWDYSYPVSVYGYDAPPEQVVVGPNSTQYGAITFEMTPQNADVYVDGTYAGHVGDFDPTRQPMTLEVGTHHIEVVAPGFQTLSFDVGVQPGQVIPYRGALQQ